MAAEVNGPTLEELAQRLEALERENAGLRRELTAMRAESTRQMAAWRDSGTHRSEEPSLVPEGRVSRKWLLSRAGAATVGIVVAGALTQHDIREAEAAHLEGGTTNNLDAVRGINSGGGTPTGGAAGVFGQTNESSRGAVEGSNISGIGAGVWGNAYLGVRGTGSHTGVSGTSSPSFPTNQGAGVLGYHTSEGPGVLADSDGGSGVQARSFGGTSGAVYGRHFARGYGGLFEGGRAQLRLVPGDAAGKPKGAHSKGEL